MESSSDTKLQTGTFNHPARQWLMDWQIPW